jgi:hypothetical protein
MLNFWAFAVLMCYILIGSVVVSIAIMIVGMGLVEVRKRWVK